MSSMHWKTSRGLLFSWSGRKTLGTDPHCGAQHVRDGWTLYGAACTLIWWYFTMSLRNKTMRSLVLNLVDFGLFGGPVKNTLQQI